MKKYFKIAPAIVFLLMYHSAFAAAYQLYELGTPIVGTAAVGQAANTYDASTAYFNPAGMGFLPGTEYLLGSQLMIPNISFAKNTANTIRGDNGGNAAQLTPGMNLYFAYQATPCLKFGASITSPYGGSLTYDNGWVGRYIAQSATFYTINVNPSVAYRFNDWISVGAGVSLEYMNLQQRTALPVLPDIDGQVNVKATNYAPGFNLGIIINPCHDTQIGVAYRSRITHNLHGNLTFLRISAEPHTSLKMIMPQNVIASLTQHITQQITLLAEVGWSNWHAMQNTILHVDNFSVITPLKWHDTYRVGLAAQYHVNCNWLLQSGISYDSSPTSRSRRLPDLPMDRQIRVGAGLIYYAFKQVQLGFSYEYLNLGRASIYNTSSNGTLAGYYPRNFANTLQASVNVEV